MALFGPKCTDALAFGYASGLGLSARSAATNLKIGVFCSRKWLMLACRLTYQTVSQKDPILGTH